MKGTFLVETGIDLFWYGFGRERLCPNFCLEQFYYGVIWFWASLVSDNFITDIFDHGYFHRGHYFPGHFHRDSRDAQSAHPVVVTPVVPPAGDRGRARFRPPPARKRRRRRRESVSPGRRGAFAASSACRSFADVVPPAAVHSGPVREAPVRPCVVFCARATSTRSSSPSPAATTGASRTFSRGVCDSKNRYGNYVCFPEKIQAVSGVNNQKNYLVNIIVMH